MAEFVVSAEARQDLDEIHAYIFADNPDAADRVLEAALGTFERLAEAPGMGRARKWTRSGISNLRSVQVQGFRSYLVFYRLESEVVEIVRVLHGARDLEAALQE